MLTICVYRRVTWEEIGRHGAINSRDTTDSDKLDTFKSLEEDGIHPGGMKELAAVIFEFNCLSSAKSIVMRGGG